MRLFSYVVARDYGFAPNPFFNVCTLATCKPRIRSVAKVEDWVVGTGSSEQHRTGFLVYAMHVTETMSFNQYWADERFQQKKPNLQGSKKQAFGDNIYFKNSLGSWHQEDSHHSEVGGKPNLQNIATDTQTDRVLISTDFAYWGGQGPEIPARFRNYHGYDICAGRNHKSDFPDDFVNEFIAWFRSLEANGYLGKPLDWSKIP
jgi:hypothetical protein